MGNKIIYHLHDDTSNCNGYADSCTNFEDYIKLAKRDGDTAIAFSNHGGIYDWVKKKQKCDKYGIKYIHGIEAYMCVDLKDNDRGYHIGLYAKNWGGVLELNSLISNSFKKGINPNLSDRHVYYNPRISMSELMNTSDNIVVTTACLQSMLWVFTRRSKYLAGEVVDFASLSSAEKSKINELKIDNMNNEDRTKIEKLKGKAKDEFLNNIDFDFKILADYYLKQRNIFLEWIVKNKHRVFLEVQGHMLEDQKEYNKLLIKWSKHYDIPLIFGTDTHSSDLYKAECRKILQVSKDSFYGDEDACDLTWKTYDEMKDMLKNQGVLTEEEIREAINNTLVFADMFEEYELDRTFKYPDSLYEDSQLQLRELIEERLKYKLNNGWIDKNKELDYRNRIEEEFSVFIKQGMCGFILFMAELLIWCDENNIIHGDRGSFTGSMIGYIIDMTDVDPIVWNTVFSRFCNVHRVSLGDIDVDFSPEDRELVYEYIIKRFTPQNTAYILTFSTLKDRGTIDVLSKGLNPNDNDLEKVKKIKDEFDDLHSSYKKTIEEGMDLEDLGGDDVEAQNIDFDYHEIYCKYLNANSVEILNKIRDDWNYLRDSEKELFYYFDGLKNTIIAKGQHPAGIIGSPIDLTSHMGVHYKDGDMNMPISSCSMKSVDSLNYVKFDILGLKTLGIIKDAERLANIKHPKSHELNWNDDKVWDNMISHPVGVFQFEGKFAYDLLKKFKPKTITHMSMINASLRPSGKSYRDRLVNGEINKNPSTEIDELFKDNNGFLLFQEDTIKFLSEICGFDGGTADIIRRCIGKKDRDTLMEYMPKILNGYVSHSSSPKEKAEQEVKEFLQILEDSADYQFGYNHSTAYSQNGYRCVHLRTYYPLAFCTAYLERAKTNEQEKRGLELANHYGFTINPVRFRYSNSNYNIDNSNNAIYKGVKSVKGLGVDAGDELYKLKDNSYASFTRLMFNIVKNTSVNKSKILTLIKLDFFKEFGNMQKLIDVYDIFFNKDIYKKLTAKKEDLPFDEDLIREFSTKETEKQYSGVDFVSIIEKIESTIPNTDCSLRQKIDYELEFFDGVELKDGVDRKRCVVLNVKETQYNTRVELYCLANGKTEKFKIKNKYYIHPIKRGDVINIKLVEKKYRVTPRRDENGDIIKDSKGKPKHYDKTDEMEWILNSYVVEE